MHARPYGARLPQIGGLGLTIYFNLEFKLSDGIIVRQALPCLLDGPSVSPFGSTTYRLELKLEPTVQHLHALQTLLTYMTQIGTCKKADGA